MTEDSGSDIEEISFETNTYKYSQTLKQEAGEVLNTELDLSSRLHIELVDEVNVTQKRPKNDPKISAETEKLGNFWKETFEEWGHEFHIFYKSSLSLILHSMANNYTVEDINLNERILNPNFRFVSVHDKGSDSESFQVSCALAGFVQNIKSIEAKKSSIKGVQKRNENADEFAIRMFKEIEQLQAEKQISSYRDTVKALNENKILTYQEKEWHISTLQNLNKRWKELGLIPLSPSPKPK